MNRQRSYRNSARARASVLPRRVRAPGGRPHLLPFFASIGPITLCICSALLISLMAILYLSQLGQAVTTNQQIQDLRNRQAVLQRQNSDLINTIAQEQSPAYIATQARRRGLVPADPRNVQVIVVPQMPGDEHQP